MGSRFVRPETVRVPISDGDFLILKRRLTAGEQRQVFGRMVKSAGGSMIDVGVPKADIQVDTTQVGLSQALAYLVDWSLTDDTGTLVPIRGQSIDVVASALNALDMDSFNEIIAAVQAHERAMNAERAQEKNGTDGGNKSSATLPSPRDSAGGTNGSPSSTLTSTLS